MNCEDKTTFGEHKAEYHLPQTTESRKEDLLKLMQENLRQRCHEGSGTVKCLDGNDYSIDSENVSELYAIDAALNDVDRRKQFDKISENNREDALSQNKNNPSNPYP